MQIILNSIEIKNGEVEAIICVKEAVEQLAGKNYRLFEEVERKIADELAYKVLQERGPQILEQISNNQLINAVILRASMSLAQR